MSWLYTSMGKVKVAAHKYVCNSGECEAIWDGKKELIFRQSKETCLGYEIGFDFLERAKTICNFATFCTEMTASYKRLDPNASFLDHKTFAKWLSAWESSMWPEIK